MRKSLLEKYAVSCMPLIEKCVSYVANAFDVESMLSMHHARGCYRFFLEYIITIKV